MAPLCSNASNKLTGGNYAHWKLIMKMWFLRKGLWDIVNGTELRPTRDANNNRFTRLADSKLLATVADYDINNSKAMMAIVQSLTKEVSLAIQTFEIAIEMWSKLADLFERDSTMRVVNLLGQLFNLKFDAQSLMQSFLMKAKVIHDQLAVMESSLSNPQLAALVLTKLPEDYDIVGKALRLQITKNKLEFDDLSSFLIEEEFVLIAQGKLRIKSSSDSSFMANDIQKKSKGRCFKCWKHGHLARDFKSSAKGKNVDHGNKGSSKGKHDEDADSDADSKDEARATMIPTPVARAGAF
ncbi:hypothetical protein L7F22_055907 [Adiantum nelumboides]|nr:hypothetical protein [Adiantum nelumboides]